MPDVKHHLSDLDRLEAPELWDQIERRTPRPDLPSAPSRMHKVGVIALALLLTAGSFALVVRSFGDSGTTTAVGPIPAAPENGLMVVTRLDKWGSHLYVVDPASPEAGQSDPINRTPGAPEFDSDPAISPDGRTIAFIRTSYASNEKSKQTIWLINIDGTDLRRFSDPAFDASNPAWSPDGSQLAYGTEQPGGHRVFAVDVQEGGGNLPLNVTVVSPEGLYADGPSWSPDGNQIAYSVWSDGTPSSGDLYATDLDSGTTRRLTETPNVGEVQPAWSPDGAQIAFTYTRNNDSTSPYGAIAVMDASGGSARTLTVGESSPESMAGRFDQRPTWSPDGRWIAFDELMYPSGDDAFEDSQILTIRPDGTHVQVITFGHDVTWQPMAGGDESVDIPEVVTVPDVVGMPLAGGAATLQEQGLCVQVKQGSGPERRAVVVRQDPVAGTVVNEGSVMTITIEAIVDVSAEMETIAAANEVLDCGFIGESDSTE